MRSLDDLAEVIAFFEARHGQLYGFRWKDWTDCKSCAPSATPSTLDQALGTGDGARTAFALRKPYASGAQAYARPIAQAGRRRACASRSAGVPPEAGADFTVDHATGRSRWRRRRRRARW